MKEKENFKNLYDLGKKIGYDGKYGVVYKGNLKKNKEVQRAIKVIKKITIKNELKDWLDKKVEEITNEDMKPFIKGFKNEAKNMELLQGKDKENENAVFFDDIFITDEELILIMELCDDSLLNFYISNKDTQYFNTKNIRQILIQLNKCFKIMRKKKILHKAIKLENILINYTSVKDKEFKVKLKFSDDPDISEDLPTWLKNDIILRNKNILAPEVLNGEKYNEESDLWSLGILIYTLYFGDFPYIGDSENEILEKIKDKTLLKKSDNYHLDDLISKLLIENPRDRITWEDYFNHPFFRKKENYLNYYKINEENEPLEQVGFAKIYKGENKINHEKKALKVFDKEKIKSHFKRQYGKFPSEKDMKNYIDDFFNEVNHLIILQGKNKENNYLIFFDEYFNTESEFVIVMELCDDNLYNYSKKQNEPLSLIEIHEILSQLNNSFKIMVENEIIHRALKLENILIKYKNIEKTKYSVKLKLTEDSCSLKNSFNKLKRDKILRNIRILAPEILKGEEYNEESDLWSLGVLIYRLANKEYPFNNDNEKDILNSIKKKQIKKIKEKNSDDLNNLIQRLLIEDPDKRMTWNEYFNHPFFKVNQDYKNYYETGNVIKDTGLGIIYEGIEKKSKEKRAIKIVQKAQIIDRLKKVLDSETISEDIEPYINSLLNEVKNMKIIMQGNEYQNVYACSIIEYFNTSDKFVIVMELCDDNLLNLIENKNEPFTPKEIHEILTQLNESFKIMIEKGMIHLFKLENILIKYTDLDKKKFIIKLKLTDNSISSKNSFIQFKRIISPEILKGEEYNEKSNLWSLGILIYMLAFKEYPFNGDKEEDILNDIKIKIEKGKFKETNDSLLNNLVRRILTVAPKNRLTWRQYLNHEFFKD